MISDNPSTAPCLLDKEGDRQLGNNILRISELDSSEEQEAEEEQEEEKDVFSFSSPECPTVNKRAKHREDRILEKKKIQCLLSNNSNQKEFLKEEIAYNIIKCKIERHKMI